MRASGDLDVSSPVERHTALCRVAITVNQMGSDGAIETYSTVTEAEVDLVLTTATLASSSFWTWLWARLSAEVAPQVFSVQRSASVAGGRETDVRILAGLKSQPFILEIEDKIDAAFTPHQPESYRDRIRQYRRSGVAENAFSLLVAPRTYLARVASEDRDCFDALVSLEEIRDLLQQDGRWGQALSLVLDRALTGSGRLGEADGELTERLRQYAAAATTFGLTPPKVNPRRSSTELWWDTDTTQLTSEENKYVALRALPDLGVTEIELYGLRASVDTDALSASLGPRRSFNCADEPERSAEKSCESTRPRITSRGPAHRHRSTLAVAAAPQRLVEP